MKRLFASVLFACLPAGIAFAGSAADQVAYTRVADDVKNLEKLGVVHGKASRFFGDQDKLRAKALRQAQEDAAKLGATVILITVDDFEPTPVNNVSIEAVAYRPAGPSGKAQESGKDRKVEAPAPGAAGTTPPDKIEATRLADDVRGRVKLGVVHGKASRFFGDPEELRTKAIAEAKAEAAKLGATAILITADRFEPTPVNNVSIEAVAYR